MRYLIAFVVGLLLLPACTSTDEAREEYEQEMVVEGFDFTKYTDEGFLITPQRYRGEYQSIGIIRVTIWPRLYKETVYTDQAEGYSEDRWREKDVQASAAVDSLYKRAKQMGADAIIQFDAATIQRTERKGVTRTGVEARGFAIDRE